MYLVSSAEEELAGPFQFFSMFSFSSLFNPRFPVSTRLALMIRLLHPAIKPLFPLALNQPSRSGIIISGNVMLNRCIWCLQESPNATFNSVSHVPPQCFGNKEWILPVGIVCDSCNNFFGRRIEPIFLNHNPTFKVIAFLLQLKNPRTNRLIQPCLFEWKYSAPGVKASFDTTMNVSDRTITLSVEHTIHDVHGISNRSNKQETYSINGRVIAFISRAVHKIAFEALAYTILVKRTAQNMDIFDSRFDLVRKWARFGEPYVPIRPVIRRQSIDMGKSSEFGSELHQRSSSALAMQLNIYGDLYGVSLTSLPDEVYDDLRSWALQDIEYPVWCMGERFQKLH